MARKPTKPFDPTVFLNQISKGKTLLQAKKKQTIFSQGDAADAIFYIQTGKVKLTVLSKLGKEAVVAILEPGDFLGEASLAGQPLHLASAAALEPSRLLRIDKATMLGVIQEQPAFSSMFMTYLLTRNVRIQEDLVDQLFNSAEKRLARILLLLAHFGKEGTPDPVVAKIPQETLADMIGTTRARVSFFLNKFRKMGFIEYNGGMHVHSSLLNVVLHD